MSQPDFSYLINRALKLLSYRPRSQREIIARLRKTGASAKQLNRLVAYLTEQELLDDFKFASWWVEQRVRFQPRGNQALGFELRRKGVDQEIIDSVLLSPKEEIRLAKKLPAAKRRNRGFSAFVIDALKSGE